MITHTVSIVKADDQGNESVYTQVFEGEFDLKKAVCALNSGSETPIKKIRWGSRPEDAEMMAESILKLASTYGNKARLAEYLRDLFGETKPTGMALKDMPTCE